MKTFGYTEFKKTLLLFIPNHILKDKKARLRCGLAIALIMVDIACATLVPFSTKLIVDSLNLGLSGVVWGAATMLGVFWILGKTISHFQEIIFFPVINNTIRNLTYKVVDHIHHIPLAEYQKLSMPEMINCIRRISLSARFFIRILFLMAIPSTIKLMIAITFTLKAGLFGLTLIPTTILALFILYKGTQWYTKAREQAWQATDKVTMRVHDSVLNTKLSRFFEDYEMKAIGTLLDKEAKLWKTTNDRLHWIYIILGTLLGSAITLTLLFAVWAVQNQSLTIGDFIFLKGQLIAAFLPLKTFSVEFRQVTESIIDIKKIIALLEIPKEQKPLSPISFPKTTRSQLTIKEVTFSHDQTPLLENVSFMAHPGEKIAIVGKSGCGKSSLLNLMMGLYQPHFGMITLNGTPIHAISRSQMNRLIHYIPQDFKLFNLSIRENLTYGLNNVSQEELITFSKALELYPLIKNMPKGFDTSVGEMGNKLSGGEKQKIALIRALLLKPQILLLDETTSSINITTEEKILKTVFTHIPTVILTSHRLSALASMDRIYEIHQGKLTEITLSKALNQTPVRVEPTVVPE